MRIATTFAQVLGGIVALAAILAGPPAAFWAFRATILPPRATSFADVVSLLTERDTGQIFLLLLVLIGTVAWLQLIAALLIEATGMLRGLPSRRLRGWGWAQKVAAGVLLLMLTGTAAATAAEQPSTAAAVTAATSSDAAVVVPPASADYVVKPGDSLIRIAARELGDEHRYREIFTLNRNRTQPDGETLRDVALVKAGWHLMLPSKDHSKDDVVVAPGDTLSAIARDHLGDARRYDELFDLNRGRPQPSGRPLTDPNVLQPGGILRLRANAPAVPPAAPQPSGPSSAPPAPRPARTPSPTAIASRPAAHTEPAAQAGGVSPLIVVGIGGLAAAGILAALGVRRLLGHRRLRPASGGFECALRTAETPATVETLDRALRELARHATETGQKLPEIRSVCITTDSITLDPENPAEPIPPFTGAGSTPAKWILDPITALTEDNEHGPAPYPTLVSLGHDPEQGLVLVSLDRIGALLLGGTPSDIEECLLALAWDLATARWSDRVRVTMVGFGETVAAGASDRLNYVASLDDLFEQPADSEQEASWPRVLLSADPLTADHLEPLSSPQTAEFVAIVAPASSEATIPGAWHLDLELRPTPVEPLSTALDLPRITHDQDRELAQAFAAADDALPPDEEAEISEQPSHSVPAQRTRVVEVEPETPELRLLGPVMLRGVDLSKVESKKINRLTELAAFLALNPGAHADEISRQLGTDIHPWSATTRQGYISRLRTWLGHDPAGNLYLPNVDAKHGGYRLSEMLISDWSRLQKLRRLGLRDENESREALQQALDLVDGIPFSNVQNGRYAWSSWHQREMIDNIVDLAHSLVLECQGAGDPAAARRAAARGLRAEPTSEVLHRDLLRLEHSAGNTSAVRAIARKISDVAASLDTELDAETSTLVDRVLGGSQIS
jgi:LysM repeat protein